MSEFSRYMRVREKGRRVAIFHVLHPDPIYLDRDEWRRFSGSASLESANRLFADLRSRKLIVDSSCEDDEEVEAAKVRLERKLDRTTILYLMLSQGCNLRCSYCHIPEIARRRGERLLSPDDAVRGIDLWLEHVKDLEEGEPCSIIFYGGEPLLNLPTMEAALDHLRRRRLSGDLPTRTDLLLATNGVLVDEPVARLCRDNRITVVVGLDGPREMNDRWRVYPDGQGSFSEAERAIRMLVSSGVRTCASVAVTPSNLRHLDSIPEFFEELGVEKFGFNFLRGSRLLEIVPESEVEGYYRQASRAVISSFRRYGRPGFEFQMEKKSLALNNGDFFPLDCTCYGSQLVVRPDGRLSNCPFSETDLGGVREVGPDFRVSRTSVVLEWRKSLPLFHAAYEDCDAKSLCGGGCRWGWSEAGGVDGVDLGMKIFAEEVFDEFLERGFERS